MREPSWRRWWRSRPGCWRQRPRPGARRGRGLGRGRGPGGRPERAARPGAPRAGGSSRPGGGAAQLHSQSRRAARGSDLARTRTHTGEAAQVPGVRQELTLSDLVATRACTRARSPSPAPRVRRQELACAAPHLADHQRIHTGEALRLQRLRQELFTALLPAGPPSACTQESGLSAARVRQKLQASAPHLLYLSLHAKMAQPVG